MYSILLELRSQQSISKGPIVNPLAGTAEAEPVRVEAETRRNQCRYRNKGLSPSDPYYWGPVTSSD